MKGVTMINNIGDARRIYADKVGKFTQEDAARFFNVSLSTYKKWEQGKGKLNGEQLRQIATKYGVTVDYLLNTAVHYAMVDIKPPQLTTDELELVEIYRNITPKGQQQLMLFARGCLSTFPKNNQLRGFEETA